MFAFCVSFIYLSSLKLRSTFLKSHVPSPFVPGQGPGLGPNSPPRSELDLLLECVHLMKIKKKE